MRRRTISLLLPALLLAACTTMPGADAPKVMLAGVESLPGEGLEVRMAVKLRVQNPNDQPIDFDGVAVDLEVRGMDFASGVSDVRGTVPRYGEVVITVPVTVSAFAAARQVYSFATGDRTKIDFVASGKLGGAGFGGVRFSSKGEFEMPSGVAEPRR